MYNWPGGGTVFRVPLGKVTDVAFGGQDRSDCDLSATLDKKRGKEVFGACQLLPKVYPCVCGADQSFNRLNSEKSLRSGPVDGAVPAGILEGKRIPLWGAAAVHTQNLSPF